MHADPLAGQHALIHGVPGQRVPERIAVPARIHQQQVILNCLPQCLEKLRLPDAGDLSQRPIGHTLPSYRRGAQQPLRTRAQRIHPAEQHIPEQGRQVRGITIAAHHPGKFLDQVGTATGTVEDEVSDVRRRGAPHDGGQLGGNLRVIEPGHLDAVH